MARTQAWFRAAPMHQVLAESYRPALRSFAHECRRPPYPASSIEAELTRAELYDLAVQVFGRELLQTLVRHAEARR